MTVRRVHVFPSAVLRRKARPVTEFDASLRLLAQDLVETMHAEGGIGLAAPQVGESQRVIVVAAPVELPGAAQEASTEAPSPPVPVVMVNPVCVSATGEVWSEEGCLSIPEFRAQVKRAAQVRIRFDDLQGETQLDALEGLAAICVQHEMDHLEGRLFIDHLPPLKRELVKKRLARQQGQSAGSA